MAHTDRWRHNQRKLPVDRPPRIEMQVRKGFHDRQRNLYEDDDAVVCNCYPRTSNFAIPSMYYDRIACPHTRHAHIQPAQEEHFDYPWTPNSIDGREKPIDDDLSERASLMSGEDGELRFTPALVDRKPDSVVTAPPHWFEPATDPRAQDVYTAPADYVVRDPTPLRKPQRAASMQDIKDPSYRQDEYPNTHRRAVTNEGQRNASRISRNSRLSNRQFTGSYVDPKDGRVYSYNVNYDGTPQPKGTRTPLDPGKPSPRKQSPPKKPLSAQ